MTPTPPPRTSAPKALDARGVGVAYDRSPVLTGIDLRIDPGEMVAVIGPNGCGKSTLLRALGRLLRPDDGVVLLDGADIATTPTREVARALGLLPQDPQAPPGLSVIDLVSRGRDPHRAWYDQWSRADEAVVVDALDATGLRHLARREVDELSGGQRQRAWIAMALAQQTGILLLDEPTTYLDVVFQIDVLNLVRELHRARGTTVVMVLHDLSMAARFADRLIALRDGRIVADGSPRDVVTSEVLSAVFDLECEVLTDARTGRPFVVPIGRVPS